MPDLEKVVEHLYDCLAASRLENTWVFVRKDIVGDALALLKEQEPVVRCKDCVHWIPGKITDKDDFIQHRCERNGGWWSSGDYCSGAEKRTDEI